MPAHRVAHVDWEVVPGEQESMLAEFWLDLAKTDPDNDVATAFFQLTVRLNARDTGDPLIYVESGTGIEVIDPNSILITLTAEQTRGLVGCKDPRYALMRDGVTIYDGSMVLRFTVVQAGP